MLKIPCLSYGICRKPLIERFFDHPVERPLIPFRTNIHSSWLGWGRKRSAKRAAMYAWCAGGHAVSLEDGFLRSYGAGNSFPALALVVDYQGIYYDNTQSSDLEVLLAGDADLLPGHERIVADARSQLLVHWLSKYNHAPDCPSASLGTNDVHRVLVIDQTAGDMSVALGGASAQTFSDMLAAARSENPQATIYVKTHPEVTLGRKGGYLTGVLPDERTFLLREAVNPMSIISQMDKVYVVSSTMGFEALLTGKPVVCFGVPWYAGWGVSDDRCVNSTAWARRSRRRSVDELFAAAYIHYTRYLDPVTHQRGTILNVVDWLVRQKEMANCMHGKQREGRVIGVGFRRWKAANVKPMLGLHQQQVMFVPTVKAIERLAPKSGDTVVCWGAKPPHGFSELAKQSGARLMHVEDGFVRSVGLGSDLIQPMSLVLDERGIYFDATRHSDLEHILANTQFSTEDHAQAQKVRGFIVEHGITKYNLESRVSVVWKACGRQIVLVPGQVEDDASIKLGCTTVRANLELLKKTRAARPNAFIVYKPHPDVLSRNRKGQLALDAARQYADHIEAGVSVVSCIEACDEVHTMTSLTGFDALLRGKKVVTYGQPFYAGWGLTEDRAENATAFERRQRRLLLDELVAGALLHYPIYWDWDLKGYTTCEAVLRRIVEQRAALEASGGLHKLHIGWLRRQCRKAKILIKSRFYF